MSGNRKSSRYHISIHTPHAGSDDGCPLILDMYITISIHTPHAGSDISGGALSQTEVGFQSTLPMRGATGKPKRQNMEKVFQSTLPMRGATGYPLILDMYITISIHTPHAGSDDKAFLTYACQEIISIHTPHAGSDWVSIDFGHVYYNFNPHSPCGERLTKERQKQPI